MPIVTKELAPGEMPATVAAPVNTYQGAQRVPADSGASSFIEGLRGLTGKAATAVEGYYQNAENEEEAQARLLALKAKPEDLRKEIAAGSYFGLAHKRSQVALSVLDAQNRANELGADLDGMSARGELIGADAHDRVAALVAAKSEGIQDPLAIKQFANGVQPLMHKAGLTILNNNIKDDENNKAASLFGYMRSLHDQVDRDAEGADSEAAHKKAIFQTADYAKNSLMMQPQAIEGVMGKLAQHYAAQGNLPALRALGGYDRGGAPLRDKLGPQWDALEKTATAKSDDTRKKAANLSVDALDAESLRGEGSPDEFYKRVDEAKARDPENFHEGRAQRLKMQFDHVVATKAKAANTALSEQQEKAVARDFVETGAQALMTGNGYALPSEARFTGADGKERVYKQDAYREQMYSRASSMIDEQASKEGWTQEQTSVAKLKLYGQNGDVHPKLQAGFNALFRQSGAGVPVNPQVLPERLAQLEFVRNNDPNQFLQLAGKGEHKEQSLWLHSYKTAREYGSEPEAAFHIANQRVFNPTTKDRVPSKGLDAAVDSVMESAGLSGPLGRQRAAEAVQMQLSAGVSEGDLAKKAAAQVQSAFITQAGGVPASNFLPGVGDKNIAAEYLRDGAAYFKNSNANLKAQPYGIAFADDPSKPGHYIAIRTDTMERISRVSRSGAELKDFVLRWRDYYSKHKTELPGAKDIPESAAIR